MTYAFGFLPNLLTSFLTQPVAAKLPNLCAIFIRKHTLGFVTKSSRPKARQCSEYIRDHDARNHIKTRHPQNHNQSNKQIQDSDNVRILNIYAYDYMIAVRSGTMLVSLLKAPSAVATVGYLAVGLTLPFFAAYKEKYYFLLLDLTNCRKHTEGKVIDARFGTHGSYCRL